MKLFYFEAPEGNVGDDLNKWLWPQILGDKLDDDKEHLIIGIGTLLNHRIPPAKKYTVLTSGVGYGDMPNLAHGSWEYIGLRGPLSKEKMSVTEDISLLDGAYLLPNYLKIPREIQHSFGYIPHVDSMINGLWQEVADIGQFKLIDPRWPVEKFIQALLSCEQVVTEAMHGAIMADAYNVPWQPTKAYDYINDFKWKDWAGSLNMEVTLNTIEPTWKGDTNEGLKRTFINNVKRILVHVGLGSKNWTPVLPRRSSKKHLQFVAKKINENATKLPFQLSDNILRQEKTKLLIERIENKFGITIKK
jgi:succinoglycan biosynthesis protein ExoV